MDNKKKVIAVLTFISITKCVNFEGQQRSFSMLSSCGMCSIKNCSSSNDDMIVNGEEKNGKNIIFINGVLGVGMHTTRSFQL